MGLQLAYEEKNPSWIWSAGNSPAFGRGFSDVRSPRVLHAQPRAPPPHRAKRASGTRAAALLSLLKELQGIFDRAEVLGEIFTERSDPNELCITTLCQQIRSSLSWEPL
jgi:hypothetical protein